MMSTSRLPKKEVHYRDERFSRAVRDGRCDELGTEICLQNERFDVEM